MLADQYGYGFQNFFRWTQASTANSLTLKNGSANIQWSATMVTQDIEQVGIQLIVQQATTNVVIRLRYSNDYTNFAPDNVEQNGVASGGIIQKALNITEWGPGNLPFLIFRPICCFAMQVGIYSNGAPTAGDDVRILIARQKGTQFSKASS